MDARQDHLFFIILFRMAVFWKLKYLGYYGRARARAKARAKARARARARDT